MVYVCRCFVCVCVIFVYVVACVYVYMYSNASAHMVSKFIVHRTKHISESTVP